MMLSRGFTLIELMITIAIAAILLTVGVPSFRDFVVNSRIATDSSNLAADLAFARSEAVKRAQGVSICQRASTLTPSCGNGGWELGRVIFSDSGTPGVIDGTDIPLRVREDIGTGNTLTSAGFANATVIQYTSLGGVNLAGGATAGSLILARTGYTGRNICINSSGRMRYHQTTNCALP